MQYFNAIALRSTTGRGSSRTSGRQSNATYVRICSIMDCISNNYTQEDRPDCNVDLNAVMDIQRTC